jgi:hypothetical protein
MTEDQLVRMYTGSVLPTPTGSWVVTVLATHVTAESGAYRLTCDITQPDGTGAFLNVSVDVRAPNSWRYPRVLQRIIQRINAGELSSGSTVMFGVPDTNPL